MLWRQEALERLEPLLQRPVLVSAELLVLEGLLEGAVVKVAARLLLLDAHLLEDARQDVEIERHAAALDGADGHEVQHAAGVEVALAEAELLDLDVFEVCVGGL